MAEEAIQSRTNPRVLNLVKLRDNRAHREEQGRFIIEGYRELTRALDAGRRVEELYYCPERFRRPEAHALVERLRASGATLLRLGDGAFDKAAYREGPDGLLAVARTWHYALADLKLSERPLLLVAEAVEKPGNLGALLRSADAAGVDALICCDPVVDVFNPNAVRASQGALFYVPVVVASPEQTRDFLASRGIAAVATTPYSEINYWDLDLRQPCAILMGSEKDGLSPFWLEGGTLKARIPMAGLSDSLNVNVAAALTLFEALRQRAKGS